MQNSAQSRRDPRPRRLSAVSATSGLDAARLCWGGRAHLRGMSTLLHPADSPIPGLEPVLTTSELAAHLGVPVQTIHDLRHAGRGPRGIRVGRELRFRFSEVQAWLAELEDRDDAACAERPAGGR